MLSTIDVVMPTVLRPDVLVRTLESVRQFFLVGDAARYRLHVNIDRVGDGLAAEVKKLCLSYFPESIFRESQNPSLNGALIWLFRAVSTPFCVYLEDDVEILRSIPIDKMLVVFDRWPTLGYLQVPFRSFETAEAASSHNVRHHWLEQYGVHLRCGKYQMSLQPSIMRQSLMQDLGRALTVSAVDPEIQCHQGNEQLRAAVHRWDFATYAKPGEGRACADIGRQSRYASGFKKMVTIEGTRWVK